MTYIHPSERLHQSVHGKTLSDVRIGFLHFLPDSPFCACNDKLEPTNSLASVTRIIKEIWYWWYHDPMTTFTAQAHPNIAFIKYSGEKLGRTNSAAGFGAGNITSGNTIYREIKTKQIT